MRTARMAFELNVIYIISRVFGNDSVILATIVAHSLLIFVAALPCNSSLKTNWCGEDNDDLWYKYNANSTEQRPLRTSSVERVA